MSGPNTAPLTDPFSFCLTSELYFFSKIIVIPYKIFINFSKQIKSGFGKALTVLWTEFQLGSVSIGFLSTTVVQPFLVRFLPQSCTWCCTSLILPLISDSSQDTFTYLLNTSSRFPEPMHLKSTVGGICTINLPFW